MLIVLNIHQPYDVMATSTVRANITRALIVSTSQDLGRFLVNS